MWKLLFTLQHTPFPCCSGLVLCSPIMASSGSQNDCSRSLFLLPYLLLLFVSVVCWMRRVGQEKRSFLRMVGRGYCMNDQMRRRGRETPPLQRKRPRQKSTHAHKLASLFYLSEAGSKKLGPTPCPACPAFIGNFGWWQGVLMMIRGFGVNDSLGRLGIGIWICSNGWDNLGRVILQGL